MTAKSLQIQGLSKNYGGVAALRDVDIDIEAGEIHGIIGPNGAGKSTFVDIVSGFTSRSAGTITLDGAAISGPPHRMAQRGIVRTFQHTSTFSSESVRDNLNIAAACLGRKAASGAVDTSLELMGLSEQSAIIADELSYGQQRRLAIAVALVSDPSVILLDEPAAGMNPVESDEFVGLVRALAQDRTVVLIEHDMSVIRALCARSTVLVDGQTMIGGPTDTVLDDPRVIEVYLGMAS